MHNELYVMGRRKIDKKTNLITKRQQIRYWS